MNRDMELIRRLALEIEASPSGFVDGTPRIDGFTGDQIGYHAHLMLQAGLATGADITSMGDSTPSAMLTGLTWAGHEFVEAARDDTRWSQAMKVVKEKGGSVTLATLTQLLAQLMKQSFGLA